MTDEPQKIDDDCIVTLYQHNHNCYKCNKDYVCYSDIYLCNEDDEIDLICNECQPKSLFNLSVGSDDDL